MQALKVAGFYSADISVLDSRTGKNTSREKNDGATGTLYGALVGGVSGLLGGMGVIAIPGMGPLNAAIPLAAAAIGLGIGGVLGGINAAIPEDETNLSETRCRILVSVHTDSLEWSQTALEIFERTGAEEVASPEVTHHPLVRPIRGSGKVSPADERKII